MTKIVILCVEDEAEVREAVLRDLAPFREMFRLEAAEDVQDARDVIKECEDEGAVIGLILCDHLLPGERGVDFLIELDHSETHKNTKKVLITGQAGLEDTVRAVNNAHLQHYIAKPWNANDLQQVVREQLTDYVIKNEEELIPYAAVLDGVRIMEQIAATGSDN